ncbi:MAG: HD domain-containing protein [Bdellovibrionales bacterium]
MDDPRLERLKELVRSRYESHGDPGHDFAHILRVIQSCKSLGHGLGANLQILLPAALLHDVVNVPKNHPDRKVASRRAADESVHLLKAAGYSDFEIERIRVVITEHSYSLGLKPSCLESAILQDADRLDALGAVGIMRMVTCGCRLGSKYYHPFEPVPRDRALDDKQYTIDHLYVKLFGLVDQFNTEAGQQEGARRAEFMKLFVAQLETEIGTPKPAPTRIQN